MLTKDKIQILNNLFTESSFVTTKQLLELNFTSYDVKTLVLEDKIKRVKKGIYKVGDALLEDAYNTILKQFKESIEKEDYDSSLKYLQILCNYKLDIKRVQNHYLYLLLLQNFIVLPEDLKIILATLNIEDILSQESNLNTQPYNDLKRAIYDNHIQAANQIINMIKTSCEKTDLEIIDLLILNALKAISTLKRNVMAAIDGKRYYDVILLLKEEEQKRKLLKSEKNILYLCEIITDINKTGEIPPKLPINENPGISDYIRANYFDEAYNNIVEMIAVGFNFNHILILLEKIKELKIEYENRVHKFEYIITRNSNALVTLDNIYEALEAKDIKYLYNLLNIYLQKLSYEEIKIAKNLALLSLIYNDNQVEVLNDLKQIKEGKLALLASKYLKFLRESLVNNDYIETVLYFNIIREVFNKGLLSLNIQDLNQAVLKLKQQNGHTNDYKFYDMILSAIHKSRITGIKLEHLLQKEEVKSTDFDLKEKVQQVSENKEVFVSEPIDRAELRDLCGLLKYYSDISYFIIKNGQSYRLIIRYYKYDSNLNYRELLSLANKAYDRGEFEEAANYCLNIINSVPNPKWYLYEIMAKSYTRLKLYQKSLNYYYIVQANFENQGFGFDCSKIIESLEYKLYIKEKHKKQTEIMQTQENDEYNAIAKIILDTNISLEDATNQFRLSEEEILIIQEKTSELLKKAHFNKNFSLSMKPVKENK